MKAIIGIFYKNEKAERKMKYKEKSFKVVKFNNGYLVVSKRQYEIVDNFKTKQKRNN